MMRKLSNLCVALFGRDEWDDAVPFLHDTVVDPIMRQSSIHNMLVSGISFSDTGVERVQLYVGHNDKMASQCLSDWVWSTRVDSCRVAWREDWSHSDHLYRLVSAFSNCCGVWVLQDCGVVSIDFLCMIGQLPIGTADLFKCGGSAATELLKRLINTVYVEAARDPIVARARVSVGKCALPVDELKTVWC